jgi:cytochrome b subunit of formate dehydrogenase
MNFLSDPTTMIAILILLITGYLLYKLLTSPIKSLKVIIAGMFFLLLGSAVWLSVLCFLMYT